MPTYLLHGFRWPREGFTGIRVHAIVNNLEDCSVEYIQNENSKRDILGSFRSLHPALMKELEAKDKRLDLIEQHDPNDLTSANAVSQPYAYVADRVVTLADGSRDSPLSVNVEEVMTAPLASTPESWEALADLRDKIAQGEKIGWWVVYNGDPERSYDSDEASGEEEVEDVDDDVLTTPTQEPKLEDKEVASSYSQSEKPPVPPKQEPSAATSTLPVRVSPTKKLPDPKQEPIPDPPKLKEFAQRSGFRKKFFGKKA